MKKKIQITLGLGTAGVSSIQLKNKGVSLKTRVTLPHTQIA